MKTISLQDEHFRHEKNGYSCSFHAGRYIKWCRNFPYTTNITVFTGGSIIYASRQEYRNQYNIAWLVEPFEILAQPYEIVINNWNAFDLVITHDLDLIKAVPNAVYVPYGDCWIDKLDWNIHTKSKLCSIFCSEKRLTQQHYLRHECLKFDFIDKFGYMNPVKHKIDGLKEYQFSIVVENSKSCGFFTEKIMDCFATGTVPIYSGADNIGDYFDLRGIIRFQTIEELDDILDNLRLGIVGYKDYLPFVKNNFALFRQHVQKDDNILSVLEEKGII